MDREASAYRVLGLDPGASAAAVEKAYRRLIKRHHPDRDGGDSSRAAEINWAYHHIRKARQLPARRLTGYPVVQPQRPTIPGSRGRLMGLALGLCALVLLLNAEAIGNSVRALQMPFGDSIDQPRSGPTVSGATSAPADLLVEPLDSDGIERSVRAVVRLAGSEDPERLVRQSRRCHVQLQDEPRLSRLDQCVAFDEAVLLVLQGNPLDHERHFAPSAVTGRQLSAARLFSDDYTIMESRLDRIRSQVEFNLAPADPQPGPSIAF